MSDNNSSSSSGGIGFCGLLTILFIGLKLTGYITWSWLWVLSPLWISLALGLTLLLVIGIIAIGGALLLVIGIIAIGGALLGSGLSNRRSKQIYRNQRTAKGLRDNADVIELDLNKERTAYSWQNDK